jgi:hypothetical protein
VIERGGSRIFSAPSLLRQKGLQTNETFVKLFSISKNCRDMESEIKVKLPGVVITVLILILSVHPAGVAQERPHNVILFIPDGLRSRLVDEKSAPAFATLRDHGVNFANPHSLYPTVTMPNASAMATGHYLGDTGQFGNTLFTAFPVQKSGGSVTPFLEDDGIVEEVDDHFGGNYLNESTLLQEAREAGYSTAAVGKVGPVFYLTIPIGPENRL